MTQTLERLWTRAERYLATRNVPAARVTLESIIARDPDQPQAHLVLSGIAWQEDRVRDAIEHSMATEACRFRDPRMLIDAIAWLSQCGERAAAHRMFERPLLDPKNLPLPLLVRLSELARDNGEHERALGYLTPARDAGANDTDFLSHLGFQLTFDGRIEEAESILQACLRLDPAKGREALMLARLRTQTPEANHLQQLAAGLARVQQGSDEHAALEFARYKELEDLQRYDEAWDALLRGNQVMARLVRHDPDVEAANLERLIALSEDWGSNAGHAASDGPTPIFIVGMPRSGTTILDRILSNHSQVIDAGELSDFGRQMRWAVDHTTSLLPDDIALDRLANVDFAELGRRYLLQTQWRAGSNMHYVDKSPGNWVIAGLIARALPAARIVHIARESMDVCFSNWRTLFGGTFRYSYDLTNLARHHAAHDKGMAHWKRLFPNRILSVKYESLVADPERVARELFAFCGLAYEPDCADVTRNQQRIATLSMAQAREPIHARGHGLWRRYERQLQPLREMLNTG